MILSRILMVLALAVLAYLVYITMTGSEHFRGVKNTSVEKATFMKNASPLFKKPLVRGNANMVKEKFVQQPVAPKVVQEKFVQRQAPVPAPAPVAITPNAEHFIQYNENKPQVNINYEHFADIAGVQEPVHGAAPFGDYQAVNEGDMATVNYTGLVDAQPGDVIQIEGTDLLTAPLIDNMLYTNSIANTNRNASQDLRGDIPLQFNDTYTPFYSSVIYGAPLSQKQMTIGNL